MFVVVVTHFFNSTTPREVFSNLCRIPREKREVYFYHRKKKKKKTKKKKKKKKTTTTRETETKQK